MQSLRSSKKSPAKKWLLGLLVILLLASVATAGLYAMKLGPFATTNTSRSSDKQTKDGNKDTPAVDEPEATDPSSNSAKNPEKTDDPAQSSDKGVQITSAYVNGDIFQVRTLIPSVTAEGTCTIRMTSSDQTTYTATAGVQPLSSSSTCKGFDIPLSSLGSGTWTVTVTYSTATSSSTATKEVVINA